MSYLASPLWLLLLVTGLVLSAVAQICRARIISPKASRCFRPGRYSIPSGRLRFSPSQCVVLFVPKILGVIAAMRDRSCGAAAAGSVGLAEQPRGRSRPLGTAVADHDADPVALRARRVPRPRFRLERAERATMSALACPKRCAATGFTLWPASAPGVLAYSISWTTFLWFLPIVGRSRALDPDLMGERAHGSGRCGLLS